MLYAINTNITFYEHLDNAPFVQKPFPNVPLRKKKVSWSFNVLFQKQIFWWNILIKFIVSLLIYATQLH